MKYIFDSVTDFLVNYDQDPNVIFIKRSYASKIGYYDIFKKIYGMKVYFIPETCKVDYFVSRDDIFDYLSKISYANNIAEIKVEFLVKGEMVIRSFDVQIIEAYKIGA